jgi:hypothetical protein
MSLKEGGMLKCIHIFKKLKNLTISDAILMAKLMAAFVRVLMISIMNMLVVVLFVFVIVGMFMLIVRMTTHFRSPPNPAFRLY